MLAEVVLYVLDRKAAYLVIEKGKQNLLVVRYVDDILICSVRQEDAVLLNDVLVGSCPELSFTVKLPLDGEIQFLDLRLSLIEGLCWQYGKPSAKQLLPSSSCHPEAVRQGVGVHASEKFL